MEVSLQRKELLAPDIVTFFWSTPDNLVWRAGQYGVFYLPHANMDTSGPERFFTICSPPHTRQISFTTRISNTSFKQALDKLAIGDSIQLQSIGGEFVIKNPQQPHLFVAFGIGITPFRAILAEARHQGLQLDAKLFYQHHADERLFNTELQSFQQSSTAQITDFATVPELQQSLVQYAIASPNSRFYIAGPIPVVEQCEDQLTNTGILPDNIYGDYFEYDWSQLDSPDTSDTQNFH